MKKITLQSILMFFFILSTVNAQNETHKHAPGQRTCGMEALMKQKLQDPDFAKQFAKKQAIFQKNLIDIQKQKANGTYQKKAILYIPVAVHFPTGTEANRACLEAYAQTQIDVINADYTGTNADQAANWPTAKTHYSNVNGAQVEAGAMNIKFCIATKNHPNVSPAIADGNLAVSIGSQSGFGNSDSDSTWGGYMNFVVKNAGNGILGYSPLAGSIANGNSVVMGLTTYGTGAGCPGMAPAAPYNLGRTVTHELGHFFNLEHTFIADNGTSCTPADSDSVSDTPKVKTSTYGTPNPGTIAACTNGEKSLTMSYMDYVNDSHMYMFSAGQAARMEAYWATTKSQLKANVISCQAPDYTIVANNSPVAVCAPTNGVFNFTFGTTNGYSANTNLSVSSGLPTNATAQFSSAAINTAGNFTLTIGNIINVTPGNYPMTISAVGTTTKTVDVVLSVQAGAAHVPSLTTPANNATGQTLSTNLVWGAATNAATYTIQTATDAGFTANLTTNTVSAITYNATGLTQNTNYYWRVKAINGCGESVYSTIYTFKTAMVNCAITNNNTSVAIPNATTNGTEAAPGVSTINITNGELITDVNVTVNITYGYVEDLRMVLTSPTGTTVELVKNLASNSGANFTNTVFDDAGAIAITATVAANAPFTATYSPENPLSVLNGENSAGNWTLSVYDNWTNDNGTINSWSLNICGSPTLSVTEDDLDNSFKLWPNPNNGSFNVSFNTGNKNAVSLTIIDVMGRKITEKLYENNTSKFNQRVSFDNLSKGVYVLKIQTGSSKLFRRIVIK